MSLVLLCALYFGAGINHFWHPKAYWDLIPPYFPFNHAINIAAGLFEFFCGILMIIPPTRKIGAVLIIIMLIAFIPAHIYMIQKGGCISSRMCVPAWIAWMRLFPLQFILMWWAWKTYKWNSIMQHHLAKV